MMSPNPLPRRHESGLTLIELLATLVVAAILVTLAVPAYRDLVSRKRVEGMFDEMQTDFQLARSEAVARNVALRVSFGPGCYVVHVASASTASCTQTSKSIVPPEAEVKTFQVPSAGFAALSPNDALTFVEFEPVRGVASWDGSGAQASIGVDSATGPWRLVLSLSAVGRVNACSPGGSIKGYPPC